MNKKQILALMVTLFTLGFTSITLFSICHGNDIVEGYPEPEAYNIETLVIEGASQYFQGMADIMNLFDDAEKCSRGGTFPNSLNLIESAVNKLKNSQKKYSLAIQESNSVEKKSCDFSYLKKFDYDGFIKENNLNPEIASEVKQYLVEGNVVGFYQRIINDIDGIIKRLDNLKEKLNARVALYQEDYWLILQQCSRLMLFGNYGTVMGKTAYNTIN